MSRFRPSLKLSCVAGAATALAVPAALGAGRQHETIQTVNVVMTEYHFAFSKTRVHVGTVVFKAVNKGKIVHTLAFPRPGHAVTPSILAGQSGVLRVTFKKPGLYHYLCTVGEHSYFGMAGNLRVTAG